MVYPLQYYRREMLEAYVRFQNNTDYNVEVIWIKDKKEEKYSILPPKSFLDVNTYSLHSWIFREYLLKSPMSVAGKEIFKASPWLKEYQRLSFSHPITSPLRTTVPIDAPVLDLRQLCLLKVVDMLKSKNDVNELELPRTLQKELAQMISNRNELPYFV